MHCAYHARGECHSCSEIDLPYAVQLARKDEYCRERLARHTEAEWLAPVASAEQEFRNKAKMVVGGSIDAPTLGLLDARGAGVDLGDCPLYPAALRLCFAPVREFIRRARIAPYDLNTRRGELKHVLVTLARHSGELMLRLVLRSQEAEARIRKHLPDLLAQLPQLAVVSINLQPEHKAVLEGEREIVLGPGDAMLMRINDIPLRLRPQGFFQTNDDVACRLYAQAREWILEVDPPALWDLYCGVGGFALHAADDRRDVLGVEASEEAVAGAQASARELGLRRASFQAGDATRFALSADRAPPLVVVNPPRRGIGAELAAFLDASSVDSLIYSSCNAESLARDLAAMPAFRLVRARTLDMFPHTRHHEVITLLQRRG